MAAGKKRRREGDEAVAHKGRHATADRHVDKGTARQQIGNHLLHRRLLRRRRGGIGLHRFGHASGRLLHRKAHEEGQQEARNPHHDESPAPAKKLFHPAADKKAEKNAEGDAQGINPQGRRPALRRVVIGEHGVGRRAASGLSYAHADAEQQKLKKVLRKALERREETPNCQRGGDQISTIGPIGDTRNGNTHKGIENGKGKPRQEPHGRITYAQILLDRLHENPEDLPINKIEGIGHHQHA